MSHRTPATRSLAALGLALALGAPTPAQAPDAQTAPSPVPVAQGRHRLAVHTPEHEGATPGELWAAGADYKVSFHDGVRFIPYLGASYPVAQELRWTTQSVQIGEQELAFRKPLPRVAGEHRVEYDLGGVVEAYDVGIAGLEQTFVIPVCPETAGDLVVRGRFGSQLTTGDQAPTHGALHLRDSDGRGIVVYGAAVAIDQAGRRWPMTTAVQAGEVSLRLGASDLLDAKFPLVVDPLFSVDVVYSFTGDVAMADAVTATRSGSGGFSQLLAWTRWVAAGDADLYAAFAWNTPCFADLTVGTSSEQPSATWVAGASRWVLAYRTLIQSSGISRLRVHVHNDSDNGLRTNSIGKLNASNVHDWRPAVGGTQPGSTGIQALLVYQQEDTPTAAFADTSTSKIMAMLFDASTTSGTFGVPFVVAASASLDSERPAVNQTAEGGAACSWLTVFQQYNNTISGDDWDLIGKRIDNTGAVAGGSWISSTAPLSRHQLGPVVAGGYGRYTVLFSTLEATTGKVATITGKDVRAERIDWAHGAASPSATGLSATVLASSNSAVLEAMGLAADLRTRSHWGFTYRTVAPAAPAIRFGRLGYQAQLLEGPQPLWLGAHGRGNLACFHSMGLFLTTFAAGTAGAQDLMLAEFDPPTPAATASTGGCSPVNLAWSGPGTGTSNQLIGSGLTKVTAAAQSADLHFVMVSLATADLPVAHPVVPTGCRLLLDTNGPGYLGMLPLAVGTTAEWGFPLPEWLGAMTLHFQDWTYNSSTNIMRASARLSVPLAR